MSFLSAQGQLTAGSFQAITVPAGGAGDLTADNLLASDLVLPQGNYIMSISLAISGTSVVSSSIGFTIVTGTPALATAFSDITVASANPSLTAIYHSDGITGFNVFAIADATGAWTSASSTLYILAVV
jgi:alkyl sulfatase BDS1-like metallo-beta-lactamase superfamily hydrolase